jgi:hypothetical protein
LSCCEEICRSHHRLWKLASTLLKNHWQASLHQSVHNL